MLLGFRARLRLLLWAVAATGLAAASLVLFVLVVTGVALIVVWVGLPIVVFASWCSRPIAAVHRRTLPRVDGEPAIESPYLASSRANPLVRVQALFADPAWRRDVLWLGANGTAGLVLAIVGIVEAVLDILFWWLPPATALRTHAALGRSLLSVSEKSRLALRVQQLTASRAETVDTQAAELRRIERDLHDGAQARLVAIGMSLGLAEEQLEHNPELAKSLLVEARDTASDALAELRDLVRGMHPPVLADRGLVEAVRALAAALPIPVEIRTDLTQRFAPPVESAGYFAVAEVLTNVVKHAAARQVMIEINRSTYELELRVTDDGVGGADPQRGTGLHGVARRLSAFDGVLTVTSPAGGPTDVVMVLPCPPYESSSARTSPSSGKA